MKQTGRALHCLCCRGPLAEDDLGSRPSGKAARGGLHAARLHERAVDRRAAPEVWIDKCCIDQRNIEKDLRCLPVFLSGCRRLVVFCGPTYLSRLWSTAGGCRRVVLEGGGAGRRFAMGTLTHSLTIKDLWSGCTACYPMPDKWADRVITAINHVRGSRKIELL